MTNINVIIIIVAFILALIAIYILYAIIMYKGSKNLKGSDLQLSTKNILEQVKILFDKNEYALVQLLATKYLDRVPTHQEVRRYLAKSYFKDKKYNNATKQCLLILKREANDFETRRLLADCYVKKDFLNKAIKEYETIFDYFCRDKEFLRTFAELYRYTEQVYSAISIYSILADILTENDEIAEIQLILAELNEEAHDYPAAFEAYKIRLEIYPTDISTNQKLVELYIKISNYSKAIETLLYMISFVTDTKVLQWVFEHLTELYVETNEYEKAIEFSNKLLDIQGTDKFKIRSNIAQYNIKLNNPEISINILEELVLMSNSDYAVTTELAKTYILCKNYEKALEHYLTLLDKSSQKEARNIQLLICELYIEWATEEAQQENYESAYKLLDSATEYNPINPEIYYNKALNKINQREYAASVELLHKALEYDKQKERHTTYFLKLSEAHYYLGNFFEEKKALNDLLKIDEKNPMGLYRTGMMYAKQGDTKKAEEYFKQALQYDQNLIPAKYNLALIYENNNRDRAKELYIEILDQDPSHEDAKNALAELASSDY